jgi:hypothetical protein
MEIESIIYVCRAQVYFDMTFEEGQKDKGITQHHLIRRRIDVS